MEGAAQTRASVLEMEEEDGASFLYCDVITISSWLEPTVITPNHCRLLLRTVSDVVLHCRF